MFRNPADILNYGGIKCYPVYWVRTRGRVVAGSKYYLNKNKNKRKKSWTDCPKSVPKSPTFEAHLPNNQEQD